MCWLLAVFILSTGAVGEMLPDITDDVDWAKFEEFLQTYKRVYSTPAETRGRFFIFKENLQRIAERNARGQELHGITKFADLTPEEFRMWYLGYRKNSSAVSSATQKVFRDRNNVTADTIDWRKKGAVTPVKDQGRCGSCWAFSTVEQIESDFFLATGKLDVMSEQQLVSCDPYDGGCDGGNPINAYQYVHAVGGVEFNTDYKYVSGTTGSDGKCKFDGADLAADISAAYIVSEDASQEKNMLLQIAESPMSVCVDAELWATYKSGIVTTQSKCGQAINHAVQVVGYNAEQNYWMVRNSWGTDWGNEGYIWVEAGHDVCAIAAEATIVTATAPQAPAQEPIQV
eukprot:gnl/TRDRNA2_/TRDRNA2_184964_c0_seq1.p1 gnl/TRDRNA2_/TRDRNA2_184964_c0~~gnl/TRDRNA2_/TRDRNA2_184964_c0_seq1.p1  ORF type:complete len:343 (-),score=66.11 gnl/TRDRNA2_/TRDRNA2_184964_c0_seq1:265-1293(-)